MKRKLPDTSLAAYDALHPDQLRAMYNKITSALKILGTATYEELSDYLGCQDRNMISRRLKEMMPPDDDNPKGLNLIFKPGNKRLTKRGRNAYVYCLSNSGHPKTDNEVVYTKKEKTSHEHSVSIIKTATQLNLL